MKKKYGIALVLALALSALVVATPCAADKGKPLAALKSEEVYLYRVGENLFALHYKGVSATFDWPAHPLRPTPRIHVFDYDNDGEKEIALLLYMGGGTGAAFDGLHIAKLQGDKLEAYSYDGAEDVEALKQSTSFRVFKDGGKVFLEFVRETERICFDITKDMPEGELESATLEIACGDKILFALKDKGGILLQVDLGLKRPDKVEPDYYAVITANVLFANGVFALSDIRLTPNVYKTPVSSAANNNLSSDPPIRAPQKQYTDQELTALAAKTPEAGAIGFDGFLLGGFKDGQWISREKLPQKQENSEGIVAYAVYSTKGLEGFGRCDGLHSDNPESPEGRLGIHTFDITMTDGTMVKPGSARLVISGNWNAAPRRAVTLDTKNAAYTAIIKDYLTRNGLPDAAPNIMQIFRVDLDGDGADEVLISAQNIVGKDAEGVSWAADTPLGTGIPAGSKKGDYSLLLLRKVVNGEVREISLAQFIALKDGTPADAQQVPPDLHKIYQFADLNGDGNMEIISGENYYEGYSYIIYEIKGDKAVQVLAGGWGA